MKLLPHTLPAREACRVELDPCDEAALYIAIGNPMFAIRCLRQAVERGTGGDATRRRLAEVESMFPTAARHAMDESRRERVQLIVSWIYLGAAVVMLLSLALMAPH